MKKLLLLASVLFIGISAYAQESTAAKITFETETIDYGNIEKGADGNREFVFTNTGLEPLIITNCKGSCGCTVPSWPKTPIAPGEKASIKVKYDTQRVGQFTKTVTVMSNASNDNVVIKIRGVVKAEEKVETVPVKKEGGASTLQVK
jgi:hypothetical protein